MPKRPGTMGDDERAAIGKLRRQTPPQGVRSYPVEIDEDPTPPPREPPDPQLVHGYDTLSPAVRAQIKEIHDTQREQDIAIGKMWEGRHVDAKLDELSRQVVTLNGFTQTLTNLPSTLGALAAQQSAIAVHLDNMQKNYAKIDRALENVGDRLVLVEKTNLLQSKTIEAIQAQSNAMHASAAATISTLSAKLDEHSTHISIINTRASENKGAFRVIWWLGGLLIGSIAAVGTMLLRKFFG